MTFRAHFENHEKYHRHVFGVVALAAAGGAFSPWVGWPALAPLLGVVVGTVVSSAGRRAVVERIWCERGWRRTTGTLVTVALAWFVAEKWYLSEWLLPVPAVWRGVLSGVAFGCAITLGLAAVHTWFSRDTISKMLARLSRSAEEEVARLAGRALAVWRESHGLFAHGDPNLQVLEEAGAQLCSTAESYLFRRRGASMDEALHAQWDELDERANSTSDAQAKASYSEAKAALEAQLSYATKMRGLADRDVARMHQCVATMEQLKLAAFQARS